MGGSLDRLRIKIQPAKEHIRYLEPEVKSFFATNPYVVGTKREPQTRKLLYYLSSVHEVPERISAITGDVLHNRRSALDHLVYGLFTVGPGGLSGRSARHVYFPISNDAAKYAAESPRKVQGMRQDAIDAINAVKPYKGGNDTLWIIHKLNNIDKHRFVIVVASAFRSVDLGGHLFRLMSTQIPALTDEEPLHN